VFSVAIYVIGDRDGLRSPSLLHALARAPWPVKFVDPIFIRMDEDSSLFDNQVAELIFGRGLTGGEVGCALAHRSAYAAAKADSVDLAVIFEDDADVPPNIWGRLAPMLGRELLAGPTVLSLYAGDHGRGQEQECGPEIILRLRRPPTHAVAYVISRKALEFALAAPTTVVSPADWPPWSTSVQFLLCDALGIEHSGASLIGYRPAGRGALRRLRRLVRVLAPRAWQIGGPYFPSTSAYLDWVIVAPTAKLARRTARRLRRIQHAAVE
jgi:hypothetical protein